MATITIEGRPVTVDDSFLKLSPADQDKTVDEIASQLKIEKADNQPSTITDVVRSGATGVPIVGGVLNKLNAATNAVLAPAVEPFLTKGPDTLDQPTIRERYEKSLAIQNKRDETFARKHPIVDTAAKVVGGTAALMPAIMAAPAAFGAIGTLPQMVVRGAASGGALSAVDAAVRGEDVATATGVGAITGAAGGPIGRVIGKGVNALTREAMPPVPVPRQVADVAGVKVPLPSGDPEAAGLIEMARKGSLGERARALVAGNDDATDQALQQALRNISDSLATGAGPTAGRGAGGMVTPQAAAETVSRELGEQEAQRLATEQARSQRAVAEGQQVRGEMAPDPYTGQPMQVADSPYAAAEGIGGAVAREAQSSRRAVGRNYDESNAAPGAFDPSVPQTLPEQIRARLNTGSDPLWVDPQSTGAANEALKLLDQSLNRGIFHNAAAPAAPRGVSAPASEAAQAFDTLVGQGVPAERARAMVARLPGAEVAPASAATAGAAERAPEIGVREMDAARKRLNVLRSDAIAAARAPGGSGSDLRAINRIIDEFDAVVNEAFASGKFSGDSASARSLIEQARASHAEHRRTFSSRGTNDPTGRAVEKILGRYGDTAATPDEIMKLSYGSIESPGGGDAARVAQRLRQIAGPESADWGGYKQGLFSLLVDRPEGGARPALEAAERIENYLNTAKGRIHSQITLSAEERAAWAQHAQQLRESVPRRLADLNSVEKIVARITGRDGSIPAGTDEIVGLVMGAPKNTAARTDALHLAQQLKRDMSPEGFDTLRAGLVSHLTERPPGIAEWSHKQIGDNINNFLNREVAKVYFSSSERAHLKAFADAHTGQIPPPGTVNTSNTATVLGRMAKSAQGFILPALGAATHGPIGVVAGLAANKAAGRVADVRAARQVEKLLYEPRSKRPVNPSYAAAGALLSRGALQGQAGNR